MTDIWTSWVPTIETWIECCIYKVAPTPLNIRTMYYYLLQCMLYEDKNYLLNFILSVGWWSILGPWCPPVQAVPLNLRPPFPFQLI